MNLNKVKKIQNLKIFNLYLFAYLLFSSNLFIAHISSEQGLQTLANGNTNHKGGSRARENFLNALTSSSIPRPRVHSELRVLNMGMCSKITDRCLFQIAAYCPDLRELNIKGCYNTTNQGISYIARGVKI